VKTSGGRDGPAAVPPVDGDPTAMKGSAAAGLPAAS